MLKAAYKKLMQLSTVGFQTGEIVERYRMYRRIEEACEIMQCDRARILSISNSEPLADIVRASEKEVVRANYPEYTIFDLPFPDASFDYVVADQVLEHIEGNPQQALDEVRRVLKPSGITIVTTCLMNELHGLPGDYWRFTPNGLRHLCKGFSHVLQCEGCGSKFMYFGFRYLKTPHVPWHPVHKVAMYADPEAHILTWVIAQK